MWPDWAFIGMAMLAAFLGGVLFYPMLRDLNAAVACWWIARRNQQRISQWEAQRKEYAREALR